MNQFLLIGGLSSLSVVELDRQKDPFDMYRHLQGKKRFEGYSGTSYLLPRLAVHSNKMSLHYRLPNGDGIYIHQSYRKPLNVPETALDQFPNPGLSQRLKTAILSWPSESIAGAIPNPWPGMTW